MRRRFDDTTQVFVEEITQFIGDHWPRHGSEVAPLQLENWHHALVERGWSVPDWPRDAGGTDWSPTQKYLWQQVCNDHGVSDSFGENPGTTIVGPIILRAALGCVGERWLQGIRTLQDRWCIGYAEPHCGTAVVAMTTTATPCPEGYRVHGVKVWVADAVGADWICLLARAPATADNMFALYAVALDSPGVTVTSATTFDGSACMAQVQLDGVLVPVEHQLVEPREGQQFGQIFQASVLHSISQAAIAQAQLAQLDAHLHSLAQDDPIYTKRHSVAVELAALESLELRYLDALERKIQEPFPINVLRVKSRAILLQLGALQMECFGYYALPYPDEVLLHNEGPIGPKGAVTAMRTALAQQVAQQYEGSVEAIKDTIAGDLDIDTGSATTNR